MTRTLLLGGGGVRCACYLGAIKYLEEAGVMDSFTKFVGVSGGAITALLSSAGYTADEMTAQIESIPKVKLIKKFAFSRLLKGYGFDTGDTIIDWVKELLEEKGYSRDTRFKDLPKDLHIIASNLNTYNFEIFNKTTSPEMKVTDALRFSMGIPFVFTVKFLKKVSGVKDIIVDGGVIDSFPIYLYPDNVIGIKVVSTEDLSDLTERREINSIWEYGAHVFRCIFAHKSRRVYLDPQFYSKTIFINADPISGDFLNSSKEETIQLIDLGYKCTKDFISNKKLNTDTELAKEPENGSLL